MAARPRVVFTDRRHGDLAVGSTGVGARRRAVIDVPWTWLRQVHGTRVVRVDAPGEHAGAEADAAVTAVPGAALAVQVADCAPVALLAEGAVGVVHAGWRGLEAGVVERGVDALRELADAPVRAVIGPCIGPECYEFGAEDLDRLAATLGDAVRGETSTGRPALDVAAGVRAALERAGVEEVEELGSCTSCATDLWSFRARAEQERQAVVVWLEEP